MYVKFLHTFFTYILYVHFIRTFLRTFLRNFNIIYKDHREFCHLQKMLCLHGKPAVALGKKSWTCGDIIHNPCCFICFEEEKPLYNKAIKAFLATKQDIPKCCGIIHPDKVSSINRYWRMYQGEFVSGADARRRYAKFRVYTGKEQHIWWTAYKEDIGRPFFVCGKSTERNPRGCGYFEWGDKNIAPRPLCHHGTICSVKGKPGEQFFGCKTKDRTCNYFEWIAPS